MSPAFLVSIAGASLLGSLHCAGMCGPFVTFYSGGASSGRRSRLLGHVAYHGGRLLIYSALGGMGGAVGSAIDVAGRAAGLGRAAALLAGSAMLLWGVVLLLEAGGVGIGRSLVPEGLRARSSRFLRALASRPPLGRALALGTASALLPCGWLYAFVVTAAGTGSATDGLLVMVAFWSGTVPLLLGLGVGVASILGPIRKHVPLLSAVVLLAIGAAGILGRSNVAALAASDVSKAAGVVQANRDLACHTGSP